MREHFEKDLFELNEIAQKDIANQQSPELADNEELLQFSEALEEKLNKLAYDYHTGEETQKIIYNLQKEKQKQMQQLKANLQAVEKSRYQKEILPNERFVTYSQETNNFVYTDERGKTQAVTFGEIVTDLDWGLNYYLDPATTPKLIIKKYLVEKTKKQLLELLNKQIITSETGGDLALPQRQKVYSIVEKRLVQGAETRPWGLYAEIMVKNFLKKLSLDKKLPFDIKEADIFQDVEEKIDFIIHKKEWLRGVKVGIDNRVQDIGIQFTVDPQKIAEKKRQIERSKQILRSKKENIQDIALVVFPFKTAFSLKKKWEQKGRPAGGPDKFLYRHHAERLFRKLLKDIFPAAEIEEYWQQIKDNFVEEPQETT